MGWKVYISTKVPVRFQRTPGPRTRGPVRSHPFAMTHQKMSVVPTGMSGK